MLVANIANSSENKVEKDPAAPVPSDQLTLVRCHIFRQKY